MTDSYLNLALLLQGARNLAGPVFMYGAIFAIFYFILIRPQQKQRKATEAMIRSVKRGDEIVTTGGLVGEVIHIRESGTGGSASSVPMEDRITIKSGESRVVVERGRIARVVRPTGTEAASEG